MNVTGLRGGSVPALAGVLLLSALIVQATGHSPDSALEAVFRGALADGPALTSTLLATAPLLLVAVGSCLAARAGVFTIGQEGQVLIGCFTGAWFALRLAIDGPLLLVVTLLGAAAGGALWAGLSALMHRWRGVNIVVSTLLMVFVAQQVVAFSVGQAWFLQQSKGDKAVVAPQSNQLPLPARLPSFGEYPSLVVNLGLVLALALTVVSAVVLARTRWGFRLTLTGLSPAAARHSGVRVTRVTSLALVVSGAFSGLAGALMLASPIGTYRLQPGMSAGVGWDGLLVALVARGNPWTCVPVALGFGALRAGGSFLSATGVPFFLVDVIKALVVLALVVRQP
ncbi:ABC transporter permease [Kineosporia succinea]|uniref:Simple sugar transport system permease protein n=1 Tax=Kineosporia succinea TaxID=84632 RepID=A0ABT9P777_9ACTN|nr:ABC transporter permease [Kineosporia succinea]MDP9828547.1 simple sugar transport system permease protein [Kineosporia succinea]